MQAAVAGRELKKLVGDESVHFIVSPYTRTRMTYEIVRKELGQRQFSMKEDPRLRGDRAMRWTVLIETLKKIRSRTEGAG